MPAFIIPGPGDQGLRLRATPLFQLASPRCSPASFPMGAPREAVA